MAYVAPDIFHGLATIAADGSVIRGHGIGPVFNTGPGVYQVVFAAGFGREECVVLCSGRGGIRAGLQWVNSSSGIVRTSGPDGPVNAPFDLLFCRIALGSAVPVGPDPSPIWPPIPTGGSLWRPGTYIVAPTSPPAPAAIPGTFPTISAANVQAQADGYGGAVVPAQGRGQILVLPGVYVDNFDIIPSIDYFALDQARAFITRVVGAPVAATATMNAPPGGNPDTTHSSLRGIDLTPAPGFIGLQFAGPNPQKLYASELSIEGPGVPFLPGTTFAGPGRSSALLNRVTLRATGAFAAIEVPAGTFCDVELTDFFIRRDSPSFDADAILVPLGAPDFTLRFALGQIDGRIRNVGGDVSGAVSQLRAVTLPPFVADSAVNSFLTQCLLISASPPLVDGSGVFAWSNLQGPPFLGPGPYLAGTLNGGAGPAPGWLPEFTASLVPAFWGPPGPPRELREALDRLTAGLFGLIGPIP